MPQRRDGRAAVPRRAILRSLALAPAALAGCATSAGGAGERAPAPPANPKPSAPPRSVLDPAVAALRAVPLAPAAEPAFVFRAAAARPGEGR